MLGVTVCAAAFQHKQANMNITIQRLQVAARLLLVVMAVGLNSDGSGRRASAFGIPVTRCRSPKCRLKCRNLRV